MNLYSQQQSYLVFSKQKGNTNETITNYDMINTMLVD